MGGSPPSNQVVVLCYVWYLEEKNQQTNDVHIANFHVYRIATLLSTSRTGYEIRQISPHTFSAPFSPFIIIELYGGKKIVLKKSKLNKLLCSVKKKQH